MNAPYKEMPIYRIIRRVIYYPGSQNTCEVWGADRVPPGLPTTGAPRSTDADDPLRGGDCMPLLLMRDGDYVTWDRMAEWFSEAELAGYEVISGFTKLSPYSTILIRKP